jgi:hypothetical protein
MDTIVTKIEYRRNGDGDGRNFLNYWDWNRGQDVCCREIDGNLFLMDDEGNAGAEITFKEFLRRVCAAEDYNHLNQTR